MRKNQPLVSIITGCYNHEELVDNSINCLLNQTYSNIEIVAFDDCSTDNTFEKLKAFEKDPRIRLIRHKTNIGFVNGLINAISHSKGEYIAIHGSGDFSFPTRIEKQVSVLLERKDVSVVGCENELYSRGKFVRLTNWYPAGDFFQDIQKNSIKISHGDAMFRKSTYEEVGGYRSFFRYAQDRDLWCRMSLKAEYFIVPEVLYRRHRHIEGSVSGNTKTRIKQIFYSEMALQGLKLRQKYGHDHVDVFGPEAFILLKKSKRVSETLSRLYFQLIKFKRYDDLDFVYVVLENQPKTLLSIFTRLVHRRIIPRFLIKKLLRLRD